MCMKAKAVIEVVIVFGLTLLLAALAGLSPLGEWERRVTNRPFIEYGVMIAFLALLLVATRRDAASYGLSLRNISYHIDIAATAIAPVAVARVPFAFVDYRRWSGALILAGVQIAALFAVGRLLKGKNTRNDTTVLAGAALLIAYSDLASRATAGNAMSAFVFYIFFLGFGEELLFRGYIQSRLNAAFERSFRFFGVKLGWGIVMASALYGVMHVLNVGGLISGHWELKWWWGFWTFFGGLVLGFVREKSGSIIAPTMLHGLPQAIAYAVLGL